jgi:hypothetical protein
VNDYPCPAGGCLLTDPQFGERLRRLLERFPDCSLPQVTLLKAGRHFLSSADEWIIVPRDDLDNRRLNNLKHVLAVLVEAEDAVGPRGAVMAAGRPREATLIEAAALVARYGQGRERESVLVRIWSPDGSSEETRSADPVEGRALSEALTRL